MTHDPTKPEVLPIAQLCEHPKNPRLVNNEATVAAIEAALREAGAFPARFAIDVRPVADGFYEILSGHRRFAAAKRAELKEIYAFVTEMTDDQAYRELALANNQDQLGPLEKAVHSLSIKVAQGKKGEGLAAWAKSVGLQPAALSLYRRGATVFSEVRSTLSAADVGQCVMLVEQLSAIGHRNVDPSRWPSLVRACIDERWTLAVAHARTRVAPSTDRPARASKPRTGSPAADTVSTAETGQGEPRPATAATPTAPTTVSSTRTSAQPAPISTTVPTDGAVVAAAAEALRAR